LRGHDSMTASTKSTSSTPLDISIDPENHTWPYIKFMKMLDTWTADGPRDCPPPPPELDPPERGAAWSAWWDSIDAARGPR